MLQAEAPDSFVLATGVATTVRDFAAAAFAAAGIDLIWIGKGVSEVGRCAATGRDLVVVNQAFYRPAEVDALIGSPLKAFETLNWKASVTVDDLCHLMVEADIAREAAATWHTARRAQTGSRNFDRKGRLAAITDALASHRAKTDRRPLSQF